MSKGAGDRMRLIQERLTREPDFAVRTMAANRDDMRSLRRALGALVRKGYARQDYRRVDGYGKPVLYACRPGADSVSVPPIQLEGDGDALNPLEVSLHADALTVASTVYRAWLGGSDSDDYEEEHPYIADDHLFDDDDPFDYDGADRADLPAEIPT